MENDIIYFSDFPNLQETGTRKDNGKFDLTLLPTQELKEEFRGYIMYRCKNGTFRALIQDRTAYNHIAKFLNSRINRRIKSLGDRNPEKWISLLKGWMLEQGITIVKEKKSVYGTVSYGEAVTILYFRNVLKFLGPEDLRDEIEKDVFRAFQKTTSDLKGSYAILVISPLLPNSILVAKNNSPLVIGKSEDGIFAASDIPAIISYTKDFYFLEDGESALINEDITFYDKDFKEIQKNYKTIDWEVDATSKNGYEDYMLKEIHEQPKALEESLAGIVLNNKPVQFMNLSLDKNYLEQLSSIYIVACGTAMHAGLTGKYAIEKLCRIPVNVVVASEFRYQDPILDKHSLCIFISQSGETADTIAALKLARSNGAKTITVTNVFESSITREADYTIYTHAGPEIAVASTKAYTSQVGVLISLAIYIKETLSGSSSDTDLLKKELLSIPKLMEDIMKDTEAYHMLAKEMMHVHDLYYIGRGNDYHTAMEGSLKLKEISYIHSEAYPAGELKHGPIALIDNETYVMGIITDSKTSEKTWSNLEEVKSRGAKIILVTNQSIVADKVINIPYVNPILAPLLAVIPLQFIAYYIAKEKGLDVDKPRNLAKSVTVE